MVLYLRFDSHCLVQSRSFMKQAAASLSLSHSSLTFTACQVALTGTFLTLTKLYLVAIGPWWEISAYFWQWPAHVIVTKMRRPQSHQVGVFPVTVLSISKIAFVSAIVYLRRRTYLDGLPSSSTGGALSSNCTRTVFWIADRQTSYAPHTQYQFHSSPTRLPPWLASCSSSMSSSTPHRPILAPTSSARGRRPSPVTLMPLCIMARTSQRACLETCSTSRARSRTGRRRPTLAVESVAITVRT